MHRSRRSNAQLFIDHGDGPSHAALAILDPVLPSRTSAPDSVGGAWPALARSGSLPEVHELAALALDLAGRSVIASPEADIPATAAQHPSVRYRYRPAESGDAIVIRNSALASDGPFSGLLVRRARAGLPPRVLFDLEPIEAGSAELDEACRMLTAFIAWARARR